MMAKKRAATLTSDFENIPKEALIPESEQPYPIPSHWKWVRLDGISNLISGRDEPLSSCNAEGVGIPYVMGASNLSSCGLGIERWIEVPRVVSKRGDLLISVKGTVGKLYVQDEIELNLSRQIMAIQPGNLINVSYLHVYFDEVLRGIQEQAVGMIPGISRPVLLSLPIPLPPLNEQQAIVNQLQTTNQQLDNVLERLDQFLDALPKQRDTLAQAVLAGHTRRDTSPEAVPDKWQRKEIGQILKVSSGKGLTAKQMNPDGKVPVYGGNGITGWHDESAYAAGTIVIGRVGYYCGAVHMSDEECWVTDNALVTRFDPADIDRRFLFHLLAHTDLRRDTSSSAQPLISGKKIYGIKVDVPTLAIQRGLADEVEMITDQMMSISRIVEQVRNEVVTTRQVVRRIALHGNART